MSGIRLQSFQSGATNPAAASNAGSVGYTLTRSFDKTSPKLMFTGA